MQKPRQVVPTPCKAVEGGNTSNVDVDLQLLGKSAGGDSLPNVPLPNNVPTEARLDRLVGEK
jgi:hypothetical protein